MRAASKRFRQILEDLSGDLELPVSERLQAAKLLVQLYTAASEMSPAPSTNKPTKPDEEVNKLLEKLK